jgi:RNA polymerase sigma-70 factor (ECF subfamily)
MNNTRTPVQDVFRQLLADMRPKLHRYAARMTGSVIDGEDVVQDALLKALEAAQQFDSVESPEAWLFRIAHNAAIDFIRRQARQSSRVDSQLQEEALEMIPDPIDEIAQREAAATGLRTFLRLPTFERGSLILMDVLGHSLREVADIMETTIPAIKAALHRGRGRLRELADQPDDTPPPAMTPQERALLTAYVDRFNARDFDAVRKMLADDVRLELVGHTRMRGRAQVGQYFGNYASQQDWSLSLGFIDRRPAVLVRRPGESKEAFAYFVVPASDHQRITNIRDYRYARYVIEEAEVIPAR